MQLIDVHVSSFFAWDKILHGLHSSPFFTIAEHVCFEVLVVFVNKNIPILTLVQLICVRTSFALPALSAILATASAVSDALYSPDSTQTYLICCGKGV